MVHTEKIEVLITVDTEIWCDGWNDIDRKFPTAFRKYIYGSTPEGDFGLPFLFKVLNDYGLRAVFFVEPLFALRFGTAPLNEIVGLIRDAGHSVELHLHTEWVDESKISIFPHIHEKRQHIRYFSFKEQCLLMKKGIELLNEAGANELHAFRAGSFGANNDTLRAVSTTGISIDTSFNSVAAPCAIETSEPMLQPRTIGDVLEVPVSVFVDGLGRQRPAQLTACSFAEIKAALNDAYRHGWRHFVLLTHSFELLNGTQTRKNGVVVKRLVKLCKFLSANSDRFSTIDFSSSTLRPHGGDAKSVCSSTIQTLGRMAEQAWSRLQ